MATRYSTIATIIVVLFLSIALTVQAEAQDAPQSYDRAMEGFVSGGYVFNARERDHGAWFELGGRFRRAEAGMDYSHMADAFSFREFSAMGRYHLSSNLAVEAGYGWGTICGPRCGANWDVRTRTPLAGLMYHQRLSKHLEAVVRMDLANWQLRPTLGKDDGLRILVGLRFGKW